MEKYAVAFPKLGIELDLAREAFIIGDFAVYWYAVIIALGAVIAVIYGLSQSKKYGINPDKLLDMTIAALFFGIIGARLYYVLFNLKNYSSLAEIINLRDGGLAIYGGLIAGVVAGFITSKIVKTRFLPALDIAAGAIFIGQAIGRWGNFVNQEAFGTNTDSIFGMYSEKTHAYMQSIAWDMFKQGIDINPSEPVHPCFLYESIWCILGFLIVFFVYKNLRKFDGEIFLFYAAWYGTGRGFIEGIRTDSLMIGPFRVSQLLSFVIAIAAIALIIILRLKIAKERKTNPKFMQLFAETKESKAQFADAPENILAKAEEMLNSAKQSLDDAQSTINRLSPDAEEKSENMEDIAEGMLSEDEIIGLAQKKIDLALTKLSLADAYIEQVYEVQEDDEEIEEEASDEVSEFDSTQKQIDNINEQIASANEYIAECFDTIAKAKKSLEEPEEEEAQAENREEHEILDTVSDEADEISENSPNESK